MIRPTALISLVLVLVATVGIWRGLNHVDVKTVGIDGKINGVSFSPYQRNQNPQTGPNPSMADIDRDLAALAGKVNAVRTYSTLDGLDKIPELAVKYDLKVVAGAWVDQRAQRSEQEISNLIRMVRANPDTVERVLVGNESILRGDLRVPQLIRYIQQVKRAVKVPVSTAEPWHVWKDHPELVREVDYIAIHVLPYWEGIKQQDALAFLKEKYDDLRATYPNKRIMFTEVGWPSGGRVRNDAVPSIDNQARFIREFIALARANNFDYFLMEAIDQPWKFSIEGEAGAYWGILDSDRQLKFPLSGPIESLPQWPLLAGLSVAFGLPLLLVFFARWRDLKPAGEFFFAGLIQLCVGVTVWTLWRGITSYQTMGMSIAFAVLFLCLFGTVLMVLMQALELTEVVWLRNWRRVFLPAPAQGQRRWPKVSLHLPICNEPPHMVKLSLDALAELDYPNFEVLVIDNNTKEEATWRPVEAYCRQLGERFRFFHLDHVEGFKAGALNFALRQTAPDAELVGVCDSDYTVDPNWLKGIVPHFDNAKVGYVQCPQDHRDWVGEPFKEMLNWEYAGFFNIGMCHRNEFDAIIQHGTMTVIRKSAIDAVGPWAQWCICEDSEMGLRLMEGGYEAAYLNHSYGKGLTPDSFSGYKKQRFRWAYGAIQILKGHWRAMLPFARSGLSFRQKFHFVAGWAPWFADAINLVFTVASVFWAVGVCLAPQYFQLPLALFLVPTLGLFVFKVLHSYVLYAARVPCSFSQRIGASVAGLSLTYTIGWAVLYGIFTSKLPFMRTPKMENKPALVAGLTMAWEEAILFAALWAAAIAVWVLFGGIDPEARLWSLLMMVQSLPYGAALYISMVNALSTLQIGRRQPVGQAALMAAGGD
jgi:exo-beta-1,3-glucanase (GH17 family)/cellulose synthase/poly-beta-1,6-N-acetylglucosamine synthase-like glycosyltransferase